MGERVLNHLVLNLRDQYKTSHSYKHIYNKNSFDKWQIAIDALTEWSVLTDDAQKLYKQLNKMRNNAIHFNLETEQNTRQAALDALLTFGKIVEAQFAAIGELPWLFSPPGEVYIKRDWETVPFVQLVYLPNTFHVGPNHQVVSIFPWQVTDNFDYETRNVTDKEFIVLRQQAL